MFTQLLQINGRDGRNRSRRASFLCAAVTASMLAVMPALGQHPVQAETVAREAESTESSRLDLNTATSEALTQLPGIGPSKADAIVAYRTRRPFRRVEEILRVRGIGRATFRAIRDRIMVAESRTAPSRRRPGR